ncbi:hypothetical protein NE237_020540 [Protea cynaroides]|uniref:Uncharacterized protein n=1 Tax=Protea cynaroides TaxID=273540 RepID=A0A9Q0H7H3_9MAGN|nr:hypothetical protein NE237_020540 [Protea cynaroides]
MVESGISKTLQFLFMQTVGACGIPKIALQPMIICGRGKQWPHLFSFYPYLEITIRGKEITVYLKEITTFLSGSLSDPEDSIDGANCIIPDLFSVSDLTIFLGQINLFCIDGSLPCYISSTVSVLKTVKTLKIIGREDV